VPDQHTRQSSRMSPASQGEAHQTYLEETLFEAVVTAGAMMAFADRRADSSARSEFASFVGKSPWMPTFTPADAVEAFDSRVREFEMTSSVLESEMGSLQRVSDDIGIGEIVRLAELVAMADGCMQPAEVQVLRRVRSAMCRPRIGVRD
jgi:tellurite resistance protein